MHIGMDLCIFVYAYVYTFYYYYYYYVFPKVLLWRQTIERNRKREEDSEKGSLRERRVRTSSVRNIL